MKVRYALPAAFAFALAMTPAWAAATPEAETLRQSKLLKPIPDGEWAKIAGPRSAEKYEIVKGDTLYDISKRLFGDSRYWPKIWALNNSTITNPHLIRPKNQITFLPGSGSSLPGVSIGPNGSDPANDATTLGLNGDGTKAPKGGALLAAATDAETAAASTRSTEWKKLPRQSWEFTSLSLAPTVDAQGFDKRSRVTTRPPQGFELQYLAMTDKLETLGKIIGGRTESNYFTLGDAVFIEADDELQVGETYAVTGDPSRLKAPGSGRSGYSYAIGGKIKIIGVKDGIFVGVVDGNASFIQRGAKILRAPDRIKSLPIIPGPTPIEGVIMVDRESSTTMTAQHRTVFIDRGTDDGVRPGMIFRVYAHRDPFNNKKITDSDFIVEAEVQVLQASERVCQGSVIRSLNPIKEGALAVMLTDVTELLKVSKVREKNLEGSTKQEKELDNLEQTDVSGGLGKQEADELRELEKLKEGQPQGAPALDPTDGTAPIEAAPVTEPGTELPPDTAAEKSGETPPTANEATPPPAEGEVMPPPPADGTSEATPPPTDGNELPVDTVSEPQATPSKTPAGGPNGKAGDENDLDKLLNQ